MRSLGERSVTVRKASIGMTILSCTEPILRPRYPGVSPPGWEVPQVGRLVGERQLSDAAIRRCCLRLDHVGQLAVAEAASEFLGGAPVEAAQVEADSRPVEDDLEGLAVPVPDGVVQRGVAVEWSLGVDLRPAMLAQG